jgi:cyclophilin family peptidyl-prolyl cis-trans isomerase
VALDFALDLAAGARDVATALDAAASLGRAFRESRSERELEVVSRVVKGVKDTGPLAEAALAAIDAAGHAVQEDDGALAGKAIALAKTLAKKADMDGVVARVDALEALVKSFRVATASAARARSALTETPDDAAALDELARHRCLVLGDGVGGLEPLSHSSNADLAAAAQAELAATATDAPDVRTAQGDAWWLLAERQTDPLLKARLFAHARRRYPAPDAASGGIPAARRDEVTARLASLTYLAWDEGVALTTDFSKYGPASPVLATVRAYISEKHIDRKSDGWRTKLPVFPDVTFPRGGELHWRLDTSVGVMTLRFLPEHAPRHVANFLYLTELGFFDGLEFHRVIKGFMAQGGDPKGNGTGGPGYTFEGEFGGARHDRAGLLSMANTGQPKSDGSQFFITFRTASELDGKHTVFGELIDGTDTLAKLEAGGTAGEGSPKTKLLIRAATVIEK